MTTSPRPHSATKPQGFAVPRGIGPLERFLPLVLFVSFFFPNSRIDTLYQLMLPGRWLALAAIFGLTLIGMTSLIVLVGLAHQAVREGLGPLAVARLVPYVLPNALRFSIPGTMLFAACSVYGRMSSSNEVVAIKS